MSLQFTSVITARSSSHGSFSVKSVEIDRLGERASPVVLLDDFRLTGAPFGPHPHAGFSTITYVFEDSQGTLRSRDTLGNDIVMRAGGIVWSQTGSGMMHQELTADDLELHGVQVFVNLSAANKFVHPEVFALRSSRVPEWRSDAGDRVRVVVGSFEALSSPLVPAEPFQLLDIALRREISLPVASSHNAVLYVRSGEVLVHADGREKSVGSEQAVAIYGGGLATLRATRPAAVLVLSGAEIREPVETENGFIMNDRAQIKEALARFRAGEMGRLAPLLARYSSGTSLRAS